MKDDEALRVILKVNGRTEHVEVAPWTTLLDLLRDHLDLTGTKKGCDHGQCGACTVLVNGRRINACLTLAVMQDGAEVTTIEGLAADDTLHALQQAFVDHELDFAASHTFGGHTSCVQLDTGGPDYVLCDLGSGARPFAVDVVARHGPARPQVFHVFMSHLHWDHIQGFPFFDPAFVKDLEKGGVVRINRDVESGDVLWVSGLYGSTGARAGDARSMSRCSPMGRCSCPTIWPARSTASATAENSRGYCISFEIS